MMSVTTHQLTEQLTHKLMVHFGKTAEEASEGEILRACALVVREQMALGEVQTRRGTQLAQKKQVHYLSLEFLMGRSLMKNAFNLGILPQLRQALEQLGFAPADVFEAEPDAALGNGGLGRLAACYLDAMTTLEIPAAGYSICYELGLFKQKIENGQQVELPDCWKEIGGAWLLPRPEEAQTVRFGGTLREFWDNGRLHIVHEGGTVVTAIPCDMEIAGYQTDHTNVLRLWEARSAQPVDMDLYSRGEYLKANEDEAMAEVIAKILYPEDNHSEGKSLRLRQQYFFVSATVQSIVRRHLETYGTLRNFPEKNVIQINDTHPALVIPELMRILLDEAGMDWESAWDITVRSVNYTNHTVLAEALERWPQALVEQLLPRIWQILQEIAARWQRRCEEFLHDADKVRDTAVIWNGEVRMANLCLAGCTRVNGVSTLHGEILRKDVFRNVCAMEPDKILSITNGVDHRRWLAEINPALHGLICEVTGSEEYLLHPDRLSRLESAADDRQVLARLGEIKRKNKEAFCSYLRSTQGVELDPESLFIVQAKRLHEYKRQLLNVLHILALYQKLQDDPGAVVRPQTFLFGAKAAPGYAVAKRIIHLINSLADQIDRDPRCRGKLKVVFLENYRVSLAEHLMPAAEVSEQISTAGKEASGTGNMKFMMNGALTVGTLDGANVEMHQVLGDDNLFLFGLRAEEADALRRSGYDPQRIYERNPVLHRALDALRTGFRDGVSYEDLYARLVTGCGGSAADEYLLLADFESYCGAQARMTQTYEQQETWNRMSLCNIARSGVFAADRAVAEYAERIWHVPHR